MFADFKAAGADPLTLGADLAVAGDYGPPPCRRPRGPPRGRLHGDPRRRPDRRRRREADPVGEQRREPVTDLQPYLAAYGHLVALRDGDLAYLHVHPDGAPATAPPSPDRTSCSTPPSPVPASTTSSWTSSTEAWCGPPSSPSPPPEPPRRSEDHAARVAGAGQARHRAGDHRDDLRLLREPHRTQAQQARGRHRDRELRDREGEGQLPCRGRARRPGGRRRAGGVRRRPPRAADRRPTPAPRNPPWPTTRPDPCVSGW